LGTGLAVGVCPAPATEVGVGLGFDTDAEVGDGAGAGDGAGTGAGEAHDTATTIARNTARSMVTRARCFFMVNPPSFRVISMIARTAR